MSSKGVSHYNALNPRYKGVPLKRRCLLGFGRKSSRMES